MIFRKITILSILIAGLMASCVPYKNTTKFQKVSDVAYRHEVKYARIADGTNIAYTDQGSGKEVLILLHGLGSYLPAWDKNVDELSKYYRVIAVDLPGYGKSDKVIHSGKMSYYADVVSQLIDALNLGQVNLGGHSMGGQISMVTALTYPEKVKRLILVDPAGFEKFTPGQRKWFKNVMTLNGVKLTPVDAIESNLNSNFYKVPTDAQFMIADRIAMRAASDFDKYCYAVVQSVSGMVDEPVYDKLDQITQPTLIFFGENDNLIPNRYLNPGFTKDVAEYGASKIVNSKLVMVPKAGHFMMFEKPEVFNREVVTFLGK